MMTAAKDASKAAKDIMQSLNSTSTSDKEASDKEAARLDRELKEKELNNRIVVDRRNWLVESLTKPGLDADICAALKKELMAMISNA